MKNRPDLSLDLASLNKTLKDAQSGAITASPRCFPTHPKQVAREGKDVLIQGYLWKSVSRLGGWAKRFYVLSIHDKSLTYYRTMEDKFPSGFIPIDEIRMAEPSSKLKKKQFFLKAASRVWKFDAGSEEACEDWVDVINHAVRHKDTLFCGAQGMDTITRDKTPTTPEFLSTLWNQHADESVPMTRLQECFLDILKSTSLLPQTLEQPKKSNTEILLLLNAIFINALSDRKRGIISALPPFSSASMDLNRAPTPRRTQSDSNIMRTLTGDTTCSSGDEMNHTTTIRPTTPRKSPRSPHPSPSSHGRAPSPTRSRGGGGGTMHRDISTGTLHHSSSVQDLSTKSRKTGLGAEGSGGPRLRRNRSKKKQGQFNDDARSRGDKDGEIVDVPDDDDGDNDDDDDDDEVAMETYDYNNDDDTLSIDILSLTEPSARHRRESSESIDSLMSSNVAPSERWWDSEAVTRPLLIPENAPLRVHMPGNGPAELLEGPQAWYKPGLGGQFLNMNTSSPSARLERMLYRMSEQERAELFICHWALYGVGYSAICSVLRERNPISHSLAIRSLFLLAHIQARIPTTENKKKRRKCRCSLSPCVDADMSSQGSQDDTLSNSSDTSSDTSTSSRGVRSSSPFCEVCNFAASKFRDSIRENCSGNRATLLTTNAILSVLFTPITELNNEQTIFKDKFESFMKSVVNPGVWMAVFASIEKSEYHTRRRALKDINGALIGQPANCESLVRLRNWQRFVLPLLCDIPMPRDPYSGRMESKILEKVFIFTINIYTLCHYHLLTRRGSDLTAAGFLHQFSNSLNIIKVGYAEDSRYFSNAIFKSFVNKVIAKRKMIANRVGGIVWERLDAFLGYCKKVVFGKPPFDHLIRNLQLDDEQYIPDQELLATPGVSRQNTGKSDGASVAAAATGRSGGEPETSVSEYDDSDYDVDETFEDLESNALCRKYVVTELAAARAAMKKSTNDLPSSAEHNANDKAYRVLGLTPALVNAKAYERKQAQREAAARAMYEEEDSVCESDEAAEVEEYTEVRTKTKIKKITDIHTGSTRTIMTSKTKLVTKVTKSWPEKEVTQVYGPHWFSERVDYAMKADRDLMHRIARFLFSMNFHKSVDGSEYPIGSEEEKSLVLRFHQHAHFFADANVFLSILNSRYTFLTQAELVAVSGRFFEAETTSARRKVFRNVDAWMREHEKERFIRLKKMSVKRVVAQARLLQDGLANADSEQDLMLAEFRTLQQTLVHQGTEVNFDLTSQCDSGSEWRLKDCVAGSALSLQHSDSDESPRDKSGKPRGCGGCFKSPRRKKDALPVNPMYAPLAEDSAM